MRTNLRTDNDGTWWTELNRLVKEHPTAPISMLAGAAEGEPSPYLRDYRRGSLEPAS